MQYILNTCIKSNDMNLKHFSPQIVFLPDTETTKLI